MTMENIRELEVHTQHGTEIHIMIDKGNGEFTSMLKSVYEEQQKAAELGGTL